MGSIGNLAAILPNQLFHRILFIRLGDRTRANFDLRQTGTIASLAKLVQGFHDDDQILFDVLCPFDQDHAPSPSYVSSRQSYRTGYLHQSYPGIAIDQLREIFPLFDPLDLDLEISWSIPGTSRHGHMYLHALRLAPEFSLVEGVRRDTEIAIAKGGKQVRTMYEETGRLRQLLVESVLNGVISLEEDPVLLKVDVGKRRNGEVRHDFAEG